MSSRWLQDYGGPGFRLALAHPERVQALIIQKAVAREEGLSPLWETRRAFWRDRAAYEDKLRTNFTSLEATKQRHLGATPHPERYDPDSWTDEYAFLSRPGQAAIQSDLFYDYRTNVEAYPRLAGISAQAPAPDARALGQIRCVFHRRWCDGL
jgi:pimeloyl-ACP methyl ester carboxylesterase